MGEREGGRRNPTHTRTSIQPFPPKTHAEKKIKKKKTKDPINKKSYSIKNHTENSKQFKNKMKD
jgi:hypothetical protein